MLVRLSSKGQLVIPAAIRRALGLRAGDELAIALEGDRVVIAPAQTTATIDALYGCLAGYDLLGELEREHKQELAHDAELRP